jgi:hypothetical protein
MTTDAPSRTRWRAEASPIELPPPVTSAVCPVKTPVISSPVCQLAADVLAGTV